MNKRTFYEFFAGGGMARAGLGEEWECLFANDFDAKKADSYRANWGDEESLLVGDIAAVRTENLEGCADLAWASFPCQDLSLAGGGSGLAGTRSGTFWTFWNLIRLLRVEGRAPRSIVLENVCGTLTSNGGEDFRSIVSAFVGSGYRVGAMVIDAAHFVPQSRPRLFVVGIRNDLPIPSSLRAEGPNDEMHPQAMRQALGSLPSGTQEKLVWWSVNLPRGRNIDFADLLEAEPKGVSWHSREETRNLLNMMTERNLSKVREVELRTRELGTLEAGSLYRRTRNGIQRAEVRFDSVAGCLRTPSGGSSRQTVIVVDRGRVRSRLLSPREAARLMGLADTYILPANYNQAYHLMGDGVVAPVVSFIAKGILNSVLARGVLRATG
ncbi:DNA (cytosine-5-)-methyltransferase [Altererythrobacter marinus]|uniref:DNA (cytosine-5-)-methyltransferase n=1 Tax=Pelagerythrobacter marinus TaxID=538382 RepID=A0ABW9V1U3_9SPHN|nr:DNA cytosine methyltransferase [Pelagerythrobacter marinus]MXO70003.1 DNA (cytosine-5-)-methyltransferase [Pelagerythrobacter marinus]